MVKHQIFLQTVTNKVCDPPAMGWQEGGRRGELNWGRPGVGMALRSTREPFSSLVSSADAALGSLLRQFSFFQARKPFLSRLGLPTHTACFCLVVLLLLVNLL